MSNSSSVRRRTFLKATLAGAVTPLTARTATASEHQEVCVMFDSADEESHDHTLTTVASSVDVHEEKIGELSGTGEPVDIEGEYISDVYVSEPDRFDFDLWRGVATVGPYSDGRGRIWLSDAFLIETARLLAHERGHNLGFEHTGGFMDPDDPDMDPSVELDEESVTTVRHTNGFHLFDWEGNRTSDYIFQMIEDWRDGPATTADVFYAISRWRDENSQDIYADDTVTDELSANLSEYDDEERRIRSNAIYRPENGERFGPWG